MYTGFEQIWSVMGFRTCGNGFPKIRNMHSHPKLRARTLHVIPVCGKHLGIKKASTLFPLSWRSKTFRQVLAATAKVFFVHNDYHRKRAWILPEKLQILITMCLEFIRIYLFRFQTVSTALNSFEWFVYLCIHASHSRFTMQIINQIDVVCLNMLSTIRVPRCLDAYGELNKCDKLLIDCQCSCIYGTLRGAEIHRVRTIRKDYETFDVAFIAISVQSLETYLLETSLYPKYLFISRYLGQSKYQFQWNVKWKSPQ